MKKVLSISFFRRPALVVSRELLGKVLVRRVNGREIRSLITEVEAYTGPHDLACHASKGKTKRTCVMFEDGGVWYVYLIYGMHEMLNIVTDDADYPSAVLLRGVADASGPGRLTRYFKIPRTMNGKPATKDSGLWIEDVGVLVPQKEIRKTPRINVDYAGPIWSKKPYRFLWEKKT